MGTKKQSESKSERRTRRSRQLFSAIERAVKAQEDKNASYSRQVDFDDVFGSAYADGKTVLAPPFMPGKMYELYEESGILSACVEAYVTNVDGYGHDILPAAAGEDDAQSPQKKTLEELFAEPNGEQSMDTLRELLRRDYEVTGNAYIEVVRDLSAAPSLLFWVDAKRTRLCPLGTALVPVTAEVIRGESVVPIATHKKFRRYAQIVEGASTTGGQSNFRYFKEFGDPRTLNALTGEFVNDDDVQGARETGHVGQDETARFVEATEIIHLKFGNATYGVPRWIGTILSVMGLNRAEFINYDLFDSQGVPPLLITVAGGELTESSFQDLVSLFKKAKGAENFHKMLLLEAESNSTDVNGREIPPKLEIQDLMEYRKEDAMFLNYMADARKTVRQYGFRLPGMFVGETGEYNYATAKIARETAEEQVFVPERRAFDEVINRKIVRAMGITDYKFVSKAPVIRSNEELLDVLPTLADKGALTVNGLIAFMNENFGTSLPLYEKDDEAWASRPIPEALFGMAGGLDGLLPKTGLDDVDSGLDQTTEKMYKAVLKLEEIANDVMRGEAHEQYADQENHPVQL